MRLQHKQIGMFIEHEFEDLEYWVVRMRLEEEGAQVTTIGTGSATEYRGKHGLTAKPDVTAQETAASLYDAIVVPGGWCPDKLRRYEAVLQITRETAEAGRILGSICHGGWVVISAGCIKPGMRATGSRGIKDDLVNAGAVWVDEPAFREGNLVWGRVVADIPAFCRELVSAVESR